MNLNDIFNHISDIVFYICSTIIFCLLLFLATEKWSPEIRYTNEDVVWVIVDKEYKEGIWYTKIKMGDTIVEDRTLYMYSNYEVGDTILKIDRSQNTFKE